MKRKIIQLEDTPWAKSYRDDQGGSSYQEALKLARDPDLRVSIIHTDETGEWQWAIDVDGFWLDTRPTKKEALALCKTMGWKLQR